MTVSTTCHSVLQLLMLALLVVACHWQAATAAATTEQVGISLRGNTPREHMSIALSQAEGALELKCFETTEELRRAVKQYKGHTHVDTHLAETYGWPIGNWCVDAVQDFSELFHRRTKFNEPLQGWDTSSATNMAGMFQDCFAFDQDLSHFETRHVQNFARMFSAATKFNANITNWNTSAAKDMSYMFMHAHAFSQDLFSHWDVGQVEQMEQIFDDSRAMMATYNLESTAWPLLQTQQRNHNNDNKAACTSSLRAAANH